MKKGPGTFHLKKNILKILLVTIIALSKTSLQMKHDIFHKVKLKILDFLGIF